MPNDSHLGVSSARSPRLLASQRHNHVLARLRIEGAARIIELAADLNVSDMTIRRDLAELEAQGLLRRVYGGAVHTAPATTSRERPLVRDKAPRNMRSIITVAEHYITPGTSIALAAGRISSHLAQRIATNVGLRPLTAVTNSLTVARVLRQGPEPRVQVILTGGTCTPAGLLVGPVARAGAMATLTALAFIEAAAVSSARGLEAASPEEAQTNRAFLDAAARTIALVSGVSGGDQPGLTPFASADSVDAIITDAPPTEADEGLRATEVIVTVPSVPKDAESGRRPMRT